STRFAPASAGPSVSARAISPSTRSIWGSPASTPAFERSRTSARTCIPLRENSRTTAEPLRPAAPVTRIMQSSFVIDCCYLSRRRSPKGFSPVQIFLPHAESFSPTGTSRHRWDSRKVHCMPQRLVRYRVKPEKIEENQRLIVDVFRELHAKSPPDVRYLVLKL